MPTPSTYPFTEAQRRLSLPAARVEAYFGFGGDPVWLLHHIAQIYEVSHRESALEEAALALQERYDHATPGQISQWQIAATEDARKLERTMNSCLTEACWQAESVDFLGNEVLRPAGDVRDRHFALHLEDYPLPHPFDGTVALSFAEVLAFDPERPSAARAGYDTPFISACALVHHAMAKAARAHARRLALAA